jgi:hypothetical protein
MSGSDFFFDVLVDFTTSGPDFFFDVLVDFAAS